MKIKIILPLILLCAFFTNVKSQEQYLYRISSERLIEPYGIISFCGYCNEKGDTIIPLESTFCYTDTIRTIGFVSIQQRGIIAIEKTGKELFRVYNFDFGPDPVREGLFRIIGENEKIGFADSLGNIIIEPQFEDAYPFKNGFAAVYVGGHKEKIEEYRSYHTGGKWGFIDRTGKIVISPQFDFVHSFEANRTAAFCIGGENNLQGEHFFWEGGKWGIIDSTGKIIIEPKYNNFKAAYSADAK
jgi:hypothetical protein